MTSIASWPGPAGSAFTERLYAGSDVAHVSATNPASWGGLISRQSVHIHWPEHAVLDRPPMRFALRLAAGLLFVVLIRRKAVTVFVHNVEAHSTNRYSSWFTRLVDKQADHAVHLCRSSMATVASSRPGLVRASQTLIRHPPFEPRGVVAEPPELSAVSDASFIVHIGQIRKHKRLESLIAAFCERRRSDQVLVIAGPGNDSDVVELTAAVGNDVIIIDRYMADEEVSWILSRSALFVSPYAAKPNMGTALLALGHGVPFLAPGCGAVSELHDELGAGWVRTYQGNITGSVLDEALDQALPREELHLGSWASFLAAVNKLQVPDEGSDD